MSPLKFLRRNRSICRRLVASLMLLVFAVGTTGIPLPSWANKDTSVPFPCMHKACGCRNAADCWNSCCCNTNAQKLAWAKKHDVKAPGHVVAAAAREKHLAESSSSARACCSSRKSQSACCSTTSGPVTQKRCCSSQSEVQPERSTHWVRLEDARRCHGQGELWAILSQALTTIEASEVDVRPCAQAWLTLCSERAELLSSRPGERPPRAIL